jgi:probable HAF family extracellular repeat protein
MRDLGTFGGDRSQAYALNVSGQVVGWADLSSEPWIYRAFLWDPATSKMRDLGTLGGDWSVAWALNNSGQVVGHAGTADGFYHAFLWEAAHGMRDLGTLGGEHSEAYLINDSGQVVGVAETTEGTFHAFLWDRKHGMQDLGTLSGYESVASHLNASGQVVGGSYDAGGHAHAFLWERDRGIQDLNDLIPSDSGWELIWAYDISDSGAIVGCGYTGYGQIHAFLATPMDVGCILGKVTDKATGKPLAEVHVAVYNSADDLVDIVVTNRRGKFLLDLPVDTYRLVFLKKGYKQFTTVAEVQAGRTTRVNVKLRKEKIVSAIAWSVPPVPKMTVGECQMVRWRAATAGEEVTGTALVCSARGDPTVQADATLAGVEVAPGEYKATISGVSPGTWYYAAVAEVDGDSVATKPVAVIVK